MENKEKDIGRPSIYPIIWTEENKKKVLELYSQGKSDASIIVFLNETTHIGRDTFYRWLKEEDKADFSDTIKLGKMKSQVWWEDQGLKNLNNREFNNAVYIFKLKNRFKSDYGDQQKIEVTGLAPPTAEELTKSISDGLKRSLK